MHISPDLFGYCVALMLGMIGYLLSLVWIIHRYRCLRERLHVQTTLKPDLHYELLMVLYRDLDDMMEKSQLLEWDLVKPDLILSYYLIKRFIRNEDRLRARTVAIPLTAENLKYLRMSNPYPDASNSTAYFTPQPSFFLQDVEAAVERAIQQGDPKKWLDELRKK